MLVFDRDGHLLRSWPVPAREVHQIAVAGDFLWVADPGRKNVRAGGIFEPSYGEWGGQILQLSFDGDLVSRIVQPDHPVYSDGTFAPTSVSVFQESMGGNGDIWVADGYGESYLHRYNSSGTYLASIDGREGRAGRLACRPGVWVRGRAGPKRANYQSGQVAKRRRHRKNSYRGRNTPHRFWWVR